MIRRSTVTLDFGNTGKQAKLRAFLKEYTICVNAFIALIWEINRFKGSFVERRILDKVESPITLAAKQSAACEALHIVKSQRKKYIKVKPMFKGLSFTLDQRLVELGKKPNSFDLWIKFKGLGRCKEHAGKAGSR